MARVRRGRLNQARASRWAAQACLAQSALADKTPAEIYALMQARMDKWTTLAEARADLREWLPLLAALAVWAPGSEE